MSIIERGIVDAVNADWCERIEAMLDRVWVRRLVRNVSIAGALEASARPWQEMLKKTYNALCGAMAEWEIPEPAAGASNLTITAWERAHGHREKIWRIMREVIEESCNLRDGTLAWRGVPS